MLADSLFNDLAVEMEIDVPVKSSDVRLTTNENEITIVSTYQTSGHNSNIIDDLKDRENEAFLPKHTLNEPRTMIMMKELSHMKSDGDNERQKIIKFTGKACNSEFLDTSMDIVIDIEDKTEKGMKMKKKG